ncbi:transmembrane protein 198-like [Xenia sp. Carnegie-2017]|uniref:transmembrane protein 198-like n=1 Tax=Xenia sp. Carnegie-2017 TaxID=2897299 RepID=UPI001F046BEB|nr:transmembrane protein 198-like [Xenia sp. Carnegie-2017]
MNTFPLTNKPSRFQDCLLRNFVNCTTKQTELLKEINHGKEIFNGSGLVLNKIIYNKHWSSILVIEVLALIGLFLCFCGFRLLKTVLFLAGFVIASLFTYTVTPLIFKTKVCCGVDSNRTVHLGVSVLLGLIFGILSLKLYRLGVFAIGQCLGLIVALSVLCTPIHVYFDSDVTYSLFMGTLCFIFGSLSCKYEKPIVVLATASGGSLCFLYGMDHFAKTSFSVSVERLLYRVEDIVIDGVHSEYSNWKYHVKGLSHYDILHFDNKAIPIFVVWLVMTVLGTGTQYKCFHPNDNEDNDKLSLPLNCCRSI